MVTTAIKMVELPNFLHFAYLNQEILKTTWYHPFDMNNVTKDFPRTYSKLFIHSYLF